MFSKLALVITLSLVGVVAAGCTAPKSQYCCAQFVPGPSGGFSGCRPYPCPLSMSKCCSDVDNKGNGKGCVGTNPNTLCTGGKQRYCCAQLVGSNFIGCRLDSPNPCNPRQLQCCATINDIGDGFKCEAPK